MSESSCIYCDRATFCDDVCDECRRNLDEYHREQRARREKAAVLPLNPTKEP